MRADSEKRGNRRAVGEGNAEVAAENRMQPMFVANGERFVEGVLRAQRGDGMHGDLRVQAERSEEVAGRQLQDGERKN